MEPSHDRPFGALSTETFNPTIPPLPPVGEVAQIERPRRRRLRVILTSLVLAACVIALVVTSLVQASRRRDAEETVRSTLGDLATAQDDLVTTRVALGAARAATAAAETASAEEQSRADEAVRDLDAAKAVIEQAVASELASTDGLDPETASCIAASVIDQVGLAVTLQAGADDASTEVVDNFTRAMLHATADCLVLPPPPA